MKVDSIYFCISYGKPESRSFHFDQPFLGFENREFVLYDQSIETEEEKDEKSHYVYVSKKQPEADSLSDYYYETCLEELKISQAEAALLDDEEEEKE